MVLLKMEKIMKKNEVKEIMMIELYKVKYMKLKVRVNKNEV